MNREQLKHAADVMYAALNGSAIEFKIKSRAMWVDAAGSHILNWNWEECDYRVKPTKTLRPWTPEEVPVDAWYRTGLDAGLWFKVCQFNAINGTITNYDDDGWTPGEALAGLSHSTDGGKTWLRCGVEVDV